MVDLDAIKARLNTATPGPWKVAIRQPSYHYWSSHGIDAKDDPVIEPSDYLSLDDAEFIANTPSDIAALIEEVERLRGHIDRWVRGPLGHAYLSNLTKPPTAEQLAKHRHNGIGYCKECSGAMALWPCPIEVQRSWKDA